MRGFYVLLPIFIEADYNDIMNWIIISMLMFGSSVVLYLLVRKSQLQHIYNTVNNFYTFLIPTVIFFAIVIYMHISFELPLYLFLIIILTSFFLSYLGNRASLRSIKSAPNPGYSLIISKSYVVYTTLISIVLFKSDISLKNSVAIIIIIIFSALIMLTKKITKQRQSKEWIIFAFGSFFAWGTLALVSKFILSHDVQVFLYLFYLHLFVSVFIFIESKVRHISLVTTKANIPILLYIGIANMLFNLFLQYGIKIAPNPGYINAVNASSISAVTLLSAYFYKDELTTIKLIGIFGVTAGLMLLFL